MKGKTMARVNGKKRKARELQKRIDHFKNFRTLYPTFTQIQIDGTERRIKAIEDRILEL